MQTSRPYNFLRYYIQEIACMTKKPSNTMKRQIPQGKVFSLGEIKTQTKKTEWFEQ
jgi:hypothetical protein